MMKKIFKTIVVFIFIIGCSSNDEVTIEDKVNTVETKTIKIGVYEFEFPANYSFKEEFGVDSCVGEIKGDGMTLLTDYGGYSNNFEDLTEAKYEIKIDSYKGHYRKIVKGKNPVNDITGLYFLNEEGILSLSISTRNLTVKQQEFILDIFENKVSIKEQ